MKTSDVLRVLLIFVFWVSLYGRSLSQTSDVNFQIDGPNQRLEMVVATNKILTLKNKVPKLLVDNADVVRAAAISPNQIQISALRPGATQLNVWDEDGKSYSVEIVVTPDAQQLDLSFRSESPDTGPPQPTVAAAAPVSKSDAALPRPPKQIMFDIQLWHVDFDSLKSLNVKVRHADGRALKLTDALMPKSKEGGDQHSLISLVDSDQLDPITIALKSVKSNKLIAHPTVVTIDGRTASIRCGGEVPIPLPKEQIKFREFGDKITVTPRLQDNGDLHLELEVEHSELMKDKSAVTHRIETSLKLRIGKAILLAGPKGGPSGRLLVSVRPELVQPPSINDHPVLPNPLMKNEETKETADRVDAKLHDEVKQLRDDVKQLQRDVKHLIHLLETRMPTAQQNESTASDVSTAKRLAGDRPRLAPEQMLDSRLSKIQGLELTCKGAVAIGLENSPALTMAAPDEPVMQGDPIRVRPTDPNADSLVLEQMAVDFVSKIENAYLDLWVAHRTFEAAKQARDRALGLWRKQSRGEDNPNELKARESYFYFRDQVERAIIALQNRDIQLRQLLRLPTADGQTIVPNDSYSFSLREFDWNEIRESALTKLPELRQRRSSLVESVQQLKNGDLEGPARRHLQLQVARDQAVLQELELVTLHRLATAVRDCNAAQAMVQTQLTRSKAAEKEINIRREDVAGDDADHADQVECLTNAHVRWLDSRVEYYAAVARLAASKKDLHRQKGSLLEYRDVELKVRP